MLIATANEIGRPQLDTAISALPDHATTRGLIDRYIRLDAHKPGLDEARVDVGYASVSVWAIIGHLRGGDGITGAAEAYALPEEAILAAASYYACHRDMLDHRLAVNDGEIQF